MITYFRSISLWAILDNPRYIYTSKCSDSAVQPNFSHYTGLVVWPTVLYSLCVCIVNTVAYKVEGTAETLICNCKYNYSFVRFFKNSTQSPRCRMVSAINSQRALCLKCEIFIGKLRIDNTKLFLNLTVLF